MGHIKITNNLGMGKRNFKVEQNVKEAHESDSLWQEVKNKDLKFGEEVEVPLFFGNPVGPNEIVMRLKTKLIKEEK